MIRVRELSHRFGDHQVLSDISLQIEKGELVCVMGASGGGKTTLLRCMSGLLRPDSGSVELFGVDFYRASQSERLEIQKKVGVVFQASALFDYLNVRDNICFGVARQRKLNREQREKVARDKLAVVGLPGIEDQMPDELSGGMKKRVGVARALASEPELLFYDEPTSGLDPITAYSIDALIKQVASDLHTTSIVVTHELASVLRIAARVIFLYEGRIIADGRPQEFVNTKDARIREMIEKAEAETLA